MRWSRTPSGVRRSERARRGRAAQGRIRVWIPHCPPRLKHRRRTSPQTVIPSFFARGKKKKTQSVRGGFESYFEGSAGVKERQRFDSLSAGERKIKRALPRSEMCQHSGKGRALILKTNVSTHTSLRNSHSKLSVVSQLPRLHLCLLNCRILLISLKPQRPSASPR